VEHNISAWLYGAALNNIKDEEKRDEKVKKSMNYYIIRNMIKIALTHINKEQQEVISLRNMLEQIFMQTQMHQNTISY
jgi:hypothetical protein